jgi:hypothetical protein
VGGGRRGAAGVGGRAHLRKHHDLRAGSAGAQHGGSAFPGDRSWPRCSA